MSDQPDKIADGCDVLGIIAIALIIGVIVGAKIACWVWDVDATRAKCVERGVAEWKLNPKDGTTKWEWKEATP